jgi:hypothetical protein
MFTDRSDRGKFQGTVVMGPLTRRDNGQHMVNIGSNSYGNGNELKGKMDEHGDYT